MRTLHVVMLLVLPKQGGSSCFTRIPNKNLPLDGADVLYIHENKFNSVYISTNILVKTKIVYK